MIPEVWLIRIVGIGGLMWCVQTFALRGRHVGHMFVRHSRLSSVVVGVTFAIMLILFFR